MNMKINWVLISLWLAWSAIIYSGLTALEYFSQGNNQMALLWGIATLIDYYIKLYFIDKKNG